VKDFLGRDLAEGDQIVYCTRGGSSMDLVHATVTVVREDFVKAQPSMLSRSETEYYDERTGESIRRYWEHYVTKAGYYHKETGELSDSYYFPPGERNQYEWRPSTYKSYLKKKVELAREVTLRHSGYITKLEPYIDSK
jgi:hypothetical protein